MVGLPFHPFLRPSLRWTSALALTIAAGGPAALAEERRAGEPERILVTASPVSDARATLSAPVNVLDRRTLEREGGISLGAALARQVGVTESGFAPGASRPVIRGLDEVRIRVTENGIGVHDVADISPDHAVPIDPLSAERIEVVRGPATLRYGSQAIGGVVNVITNRVPKRRPARPLSVAIQGSMDDASDLTEGAVRADAGIGMLAIHLDAFKRDTDDYRIPIEPGVLPFSDSEASGSAAGAALIGEKGRVGFAFRRFESTYLVPGPENPDEPLSLEVEQDKWLLEAELYKPVSFIETVRAEGGLTDYTHDEIAGFTDIGSTFDSEQWEARTEIEHAVIGPFRGALGVQLEHRDLSAAGEGGELLSPSEAFTKALYLFEEVALSERFTLSLAGRVERVAVDGTPQSDIFTERDFTPLSGSVGLVAQLSSTLSIGGTFSAVERAPSARELFSRGPHEATETFEIGDATLDEERAFAGEMFLAISHPRWSGEVRGFTTGYEGFIFPALTGLTVDEAGIPDPAGELNELVFRQEDVRFRGAEAKATFILGAVLGGTLGVNARLDYVRATLDAGGNVPRIPPLRYGGGFFFEAQGFEASLDALHVSEQDKVADNETPTDGYTTLRASLGYRIERQAHSGLPGIRVLIVGDNLTDTVQRNHVSFKKDDIVAAGRSVRLTVTAEF